MSSTIGANRESNPHDFLVTPEWCVRGIFNAIQRGSSSPWRPNRILDPCSGDGAILRVGHTFFPGAEKWGLEIDPVRSKLSRESGAIVRTGDALMLPTWADKDGRRPDLICTNPPFSLAMEFLERSLAEVEDFGVVAFLLRLAWLSSLDRVAFHLKHPSDVHVLDRRPSFAASIKCKARKPKKGDMKEPCTFRMMLPLTASRPKECPLCGAGIDVTTNDSADYAWFVFGQGRGNRWWILESEATGTSIDRIDNDKGYFPKNCRWASPKEQSRNTSRSRRIVYRGRSLTVADWSDITGINVQTLKARLLKGWPPDLILFVPLLAGGRTACSERSLRERFRRDIEQGTKRCRLPSFKAKRSVGHSRPMILSGILSICVSASAVSMTAPATGASPRSTIS
jgi:hypothetical protein